MGVVMILKIGKHEYTITEKDVFLDNGCCVQLLTQSKVFKNWGYMTPVLSKKAIKELENYGVEKTFSKHKGCSEWRINSK